MARHPIPAVIAVVLREDHVLLVQRRNEPDAGKWGFPGGKIEFGETVESAALRELQEETDISAIPGEVLTTVDVIPDFGFQQDQLHFLLIALQCHWTCGEPMAGDDALDAQWFAIADVIAHKLDQSEYVDRVLAIAQQRRV